MSFGSHALPELEIILVCDILTEHLARFGSEISDMKETVLGGVYQPTLILMIFVDGFQIGLLHLVMVARMSGFALTCLGVSRIPVDLAEAVKHDIDSSIIGYSSYRLDGRDSSKQLVLKVRGS